MPMSTSMSRQPRLSKAERKELKDMKTAIESEPWSTDDMLRVITDVMKLRSFRGIVRVGEEGLVEVSLRAGVAANRRTWA